MTDIPIIKDPKFKDPKEPQMRWLHLHLSNFASSLKNMFESLDAKYLDFELQQAIAYQAERVIEASKKLKDTLEEYFSNINYEIYEALEDKVIARFKLTAKRLNESEREIRESLTKVSDLKRYLREIEELVTTIERLESNPKLETTLTRLTTLLKNTS